MLQTDGAIIVGVHPFLFAILVILRSIIITKKRIEKADNGDKTMR